MNLSTTTAAVTPTTDPAWVLEEDGFNLAREHEIESLFAVGNGYIGSRGSIAEGSSLSAPATFIAGVYDNDPVSALPELAVAPDWMRLRARVNGADIRIEGSKVDVHRRLLDMRQGMFWREWRHEDSEGRVTHVRELRFASLADRHLLLQCVWLTPENYSARMEFETHIEPPANRPGRMELLYERREVRPEAIARVLPLCTLNTGVKVVFAAASRMRLPDGTWREPARGRHEDIELWSVDVEMGKVYRLERFVLVYTSRESRSPAAAAVRDIRNVLAKGMDTLVDEHRTAWHERWREADVRIEGDVEAQRAVRFACYHLIAAANPDDERVSIGARGLTGDSYKGHVFWDTEIFMLPFYIFTHPRAARALLMYRYHTLPAAREKARQYGLRGAFYAWESADSGVDITPPYVIMPDGKLIPVLNAAQEQHITADVAYGVWQYWQATGDEEFLRAAGAEILLETARFWSSRAQRGDDGHYHITGVVGPDEYHMTVDDNAFTNVMAQWNLETAVQAARLLQARWPEQWAELARRLVIDDGELAQWQAIAHGLYVGIDDATALIEQFRGYFDLEQLSAARYLAQRTPLELSIGPERLPKTCLIKQADVVMLIFLLWDRFSPRERGANFEYYERRTAHGSSLSPAIHALVAARLGRRDLALRYFRQAAEIDLSNNMGNAAGGVHAAASGGLWQAAVFGFAGMIPHAHGIGFIPHLPTGWREMQFLVHWHALELNVMLTHETFEIAAAGSGKVPISVGEAPPVHIGAGSTVRWRRAGDRSWQEIRP